MSELDDLRAELEQVKKERDAVRACFAEASHNAGPAFVAHEELNRLKAENETLHRDAAEDDELRMKMSAILDATANALKGDPGRMKRHSWHDLAEVAQALRAEKK